MELERGDIQSKIVLILLDYRGRGAGKAKFFLPKIGMTEELPLF